MAFAFVLSAQPATLVRDIHPPGIPYSGAYGSNPTAPTLFNGDAYFGVSYPFNPLHGLWRTDGTTENTRAVFPEEPAAMAELAGSLFFIGGGPNTNAGLWRTDGTAAGTTLVRAFDGCAGNGLPLPGPLVATGDHLFFTGFADGAGEELWVSDGTNGGTHLVDVNPGPEGSAPSQLTPVSSKLVFFRMDSFHGGELWVSDGSGPGTTLLRAFTQDLLGPIVSTGGHAFLNRCDGTPSGCGIWTTDGTAGGTIQLTDDLAGRMFAWGSTLLFFSGSELWRSDGTLGGTTKITDLPVASRYDGFAVLGSDAYFVLGEFTSPPQLWKTDGTTGGTSYVTSFGSGLLTIEMKTVDATVFMGFPYSIPPQIWKSDGTVPGTQLVAALPPEDPSSDHLGNLVAVQNRLFFTYGDVQHGLEPWISDGTAAGTFVLADIDRDPTSSDPVSFGSLNDTLLFAADDGVQTRALWRSGGRTENTQLVTDSLSNVGIVNGASTPGFVQIGRIAVFSASTPGSGYQLWRTDATAAGTQLVKDVGASELTPLGDIAVFYGPGGVWRTDGTDAGTVQLVDGVGVLPPGFVDFEGALFFLGSSSGHYGLWKTDGTAVGTVEVAPLNPAFGNDYPYELVKSASLLFFRATSPETGYELWKSDGTGPGTAMVTELVPGPGTAYIYRLTDAGGLLFFTAYAANGDELWKSDGTAQGTVPLTSIPGPWPYGPAPDSLHDVDGILFFSMADCQHGRELWRSDGTPEGTVLVKDIRPGPADSSPRILAVVNGEMLLTATDDEHGDELWKSDGTEPGTLFFQDIAPGPASSAALYPSDRAVGKRLYFTADDSQTGTELWSVPVALLTGVAIAPTSGPAAGGTRVAVSGNYAPGTAVQIGDADASNIDIPTPSYLTATAPALTPGSLDDVVVSSPGGAGATLANAWFADFLDVDAAHPFHDFIESIVRAGITAGCGGGNYCPAAPVTRAQMAVFLLKAGHGSSYVPPPCTGVFTDVACPSTFADWIEQLAAEGVTGGCGGGNYCPASAATRAQMAVFLLKTLLGSSYVPPPAAGIFGDVPPGAFAADWIEDLYARQVTGGCAPSPLLYCPDAPNTRGQMAVFLTKTFSLP